MSQQVRFIALVGTFVVQDSSSDKTFHLVCVYDDCQTSFSLIHCSPDSFAGQAKNWRWRIFMFAIARIGPVSPFTISCMYVVSRVTLRLCSRERHQVHSFWRILRPYVAPPSCRWYVSGYGVTLISYIHVRFLSSGIILVLSFLPVYFASSKMMTSQKWFFSIYGFGTTYLIKVHTQKYWLFSALSSWDMEFWSSSCFWS